MKIYTQRLDEIASDRAFETVELSNGTDIGADLPRTGILRSGSFIATNEGEVLRVDAKPEQLMQVTAKTDFELLKAAYHLGNRHVPLMLTPYELYFEPDHVLAEMVEGLGLHVKLVEHAFEPESGAYAQHAHDHRLSPIKSLHHVH